MDGLWIMLGILGGLLVLLALMAFLARFRGGRYLQPVARLLARIPFIRRQMTKASIRAVERDNPQLASAMRKMETFGAPTTPQQAQRALNLLTPAERKAYLEAVQEQQSFQEAAPEPQNRAQRRRMQQGFGPQQQRQRQGGGGKRKRR